MVDKSFHVGLDIGTASIKVIVSEFARQQLNVIGVGVERSRGVSRGIIVDIDAAADAIRKAVKKAEQRANVTIKSVVVGVPGNQILVEQCQGMIAVSSENREITDKDVNNVISAAKVRSVPPEREIISILPQEFVVDGFDGIRDPRGMIGVRLELYANLVTGPKTIIHNIRKCVERAGLTISELVIQPLATSKVALNAGERSFGTVLIDMGAGQTSVAAIHDDQVKFVYNDPEGGDLVTQDISKVLNTSPDNSEMIKKEYGYAISEHITEDNHFLVEKVGHREPVRVSEGHLSEIIEARLEQTFENIKHSLDRVDALSLPGGVILTGGASLLPGVTELAQRILEVPVKTYTPNQMGLRHPGFSQALGLVSYTVGLDEIHHFAQGDNNISSNASPARGVSEVRRRMQESTEQLVRSVENQTDRVRSSQPAEDTPSEKENTQGNFFQRIGNSFRGFFDSLGEE